jgi:hypothetical protein
MIEVWFRERIDLPEFGWIMVFSLNAWVRIHQLGRELAIFGLPFIRLGACFLKNSQFYEQRKNGRRPSAH